MTDKVGFNQITILPGAFELESLNTEIKKITFDEGHFSKTDCAFTKKPIF